MSIVIAVANQKGGVGKTTLCRELSACFALRGQRVLVIDSDPQGNLTNSWVNSDIYQYTLSHVLLEPDVEGGKKSEPLPLSETIVETPVNNLDLVPADIRLARFDFQPDYLTFRLKNEIELMADDYDVVFIDCPPQLGKLLTAGLYAAQFVLIPCSSDVMGLPGIGDLTYTIGRIRQNVNNKLEILGAVMNLYKPQRNLSAEARDAVELAVDELKFVFDTNLHDYSKIAEAPSQRLPVVLYAPNHNAAEQLERLTDEVMDRLKLPRRNLSVVKNEAS